MIPAHCKKPGRLLRVISRQSTTNRHYSISARAVIIHRHLVRGEKFFDCTNNERLFSARGAVRDIATNSNTTSARAFIPSPEQQAVVELCDTQNVVISARPGAGKTATAEAIVAAEPNRPIAVVTYSKRLQLGTARRLAAYPDSDVFTFHGLAGLLFSTTVHNDSILRSLRHTGDVPAWTGHLYEIVILDELQDCTDDLFWLICAFISAVTHAAGGKAPRIVVLGDERQAIYEFRGADARYLSLSSAAMTALSPYQWTQLALSKSFRMSQENAAFVNNVFLRGEQYIIGTHSGPRPLYLYGDAFNVGSVSRHLIPLIRQYGPERTAILAPTVRHNRQVSSLTNHLSEVHGIPIAVSIADDIPLDDKVLRGKICVSTYHQFKGNERDLVVVYGVDAGYFQFLGRDLPDDNCPNTTFVALTRAREQLVVVHDHRNGPMPFTDVEALNKTAVFVHLQGDGEMPKAEPPGRPLLLGLLLPRAAFASEISRHVFDEVVDGICTKHLLINQIRRPLPKHLHINAPATVVTDVIKKHHEAVSDLNGLAVVAAYEHALLGTLTTLKVTKKQLLEFAFSTDRKAQAIWLCHEACKYEAEISGYKSRNLQMKGHPFDWLTSYLDAARARLEAQFPASAMLKFEVSLEEDDFRVVNPLGGKDQTTLVMGRADIIHYENSLSSSPMKSTRKGSIDDMDLDYVSIWEIKFAAQLSLQHAIQACIYAYLWTHEHNRPVPPRIVLFNVRDGEKWDIVPRDGIASLKRVVEETLVAKYSTNNRLTTDEFLKKCAKTKAEVERSFGRSK